MIGISSRRTLICMGIAATVVLVVAMTRVAMGEVRQLILWAEESVEAEKSCRASLQDLREILNPETNSTINSTDG